ncbi:PAS domain-containing protein [Halopiger aswanensis]|uniref:PAS domain S-box-containing protein n=1 Tax=Halopiger aswanensis TaxID=148449 RepID=A0A419WEI8_9EURY|nr:PAS domain-containing protein [Halopiger aswanensis]RKD93877.1 PAS domain S-box-containing protein [Halopiger aswanensis]
MQEFSTAALGPDLQTRHADITVLVATHRSSLERAAARLEAALCDVYDSDADVDVDLRTLPSFSAPESTPTLLERLADADCLVLEQAASESSAADADVAAVLEAVRRRYPSRPAIVVSDAPPDDGSTPVTDAVRSYRFIDHVRTADLVTTDAVADDPRCDRAYERLARRVRSAIARRRLDGLSTRLLAGIQLSQDAIAVAGPDGRLEAANCWFAAQFGYEHETLCGRSWTDFFTAEAVAHLEATAIPTAADGWRWTGTCTGRRRSGEPIPVRVRLAGLEDGSLVFVVESAVDEDDGESADGEESVLDGEP